MSERSIVASILLKLLADQPKQAIEELRAAEKNLADQGITTTRSLADGFETFENAATKTLKKIVDGTDVSEKEMENLVGRLAQLKIVAEQIDGDKLPEQFRQGFQVAEGQLRTAQEALAQLRSRTTEVKEDFVDLNAEVRRAGEHAEEAAERFGSIPDRIEEIRKSSNKTFDEQKKDLEAIEKELRDQEAQYRKLGPEGEQALRRIRVESDRVEAALKELSVESSESVGKLRDDFIRAERAMGDLENSIEVASPKAGAKFAQTGVQVDRLRERFDQLRKAGLVSDDQLAKLTQLERRLESNRGEAEKLSDSLGELKDRTKEGGEAWTGLGAAIDKAAGPMGGIIARIGLYFAALKEGWQIGSTVAKGIGTDFTAMEEASENVRRSLSTITNALTTDGWGAAWDQARAFVKTFGDNITGSGKAMEGFNALVSSGVDRANALAVETDDLAKIASAYTLVVQGGAQAHALWQQTINSTDPAQIAEKLEALRAKFEALKKETEKAAEAEQKRVALVKDTIAAIDAVIQKMEAEKMARQSGLAGLELEILKRQALMKAHQDSIQTEELARDVKGGLSATMAEELELLKGLLPQYEKNRVEIENYAKALATDVEIYRNGLTPEEEKRLRNLAEQIVKYGELDPVAKGHIQNQIDAALRTHEAAKAAGQNASELSKASQEWLGMGKSAVKAAGDLEKGTGVISNTGKEAGAVSTKVGALAKGLQDISISTIKLGEKKGTFSDFGDTLKRSGSDVETYTGKLAAMNREVQGIAEGLKIVVQHMNELGKISKGGASPAASVAETARQRYTNLIQNVDESAGVGAPQSGLSGGGSTGGF